MCGNAIHLFIPRLTSLQTTQLSDFASAKGVIANSGWVFISSNDQSTKLLTRTDKCLPVG
jgi:hypothetical protein